MEYKQTNFTKDEVIEIVSRYIGIKESSFRNSIELLIKLEVIPQYAFKEEQPKVTFSTTKMSK